MVDPERMKRIAEKMKGMNIPELLQAGKEAYEQMGLSDEAFHLKTANELGVILKAMHVEEGDPLPMLIFHDHEDAVYICALADFMELDTSKKQQDYLVSMGGVVGSEGTVVKTAFFSCLAWQAHEDAGNHSGLQPKDNPLREEVLLFVGSSFCGKRAHASIPTGRNTDNPIEGATRYPSSKDIEVQFYKRGDPRMTSFLIEAWWYGHRLGFIGKHSDVIETFRKKFDEQKRQN